MLCPLGAFIVNYLRTSMIVKSVEMSDTPCSATECIAAAERFESHKCDENKPCDSFYDHICGNYMNTKTIPSHVDYMDTVYERTIGINEKILNYFEKSKKESKPGFQKIRSFYEACNQESIPAIPFYEQLKDELTFVGFTLKSPFFKVSLQGVISPAKILAKLHATSVGEPGFLFEIHVKDKNYGKGIQFTPARNSLLYETENMPHLQEALADYILDVSVILWRITGMVSKMEQNAAVAEQRIQDVAKFLIELIKIQEAPFKKNTENNPMSVFDLQQWTSDQLNEGEIKINWTEFFKTLYEDERINTLIQSNKKVIYVKSKDQMEKIFQLLKQTTAEVFTAAMWWYKVQSLEEFFPNNLAKFRQNYEPYAIRLTRAPRSERCLGWIWTHFGLFVNHLLAREFRSIRTRERVSKMAENIVQTLALSFYKTSWSDETTKQRAIDKLSQMHMHVGFTDSVQDANFVEKTYDNVEIIKERFIQTLSTLFREKKKNNFLQIFSDDYDVFDENRVRVGIFYYRHSNVLEIPIAILGPPFYDHGLEALNYGFLGTHISHMAWHALDMKGREFDENGASNYWWSPATTQNFEVYVRRFQVINSNYVRPLATCVDGERTVVENMADWSGFKISLRAYRRSFKAGETEMRLPKFTDYTPKQLFIMAFANSFCIKARLSFLTNQIKGGPIPPNIARVDAVLKNSKLFSRLWDCKYVERMNPQQKYNFWR